MRFGEIEKKILNESANIVSSRDRHQTRFLKNLKETFQKVDRDIKKIQGFESLNLLAEDSTGYSQEYQTYRKFLESMAGRPDCDPYELESFLESRSTLSKVAKLVLNRLKSSYKPSESEQLQAAYDVYTRWRRGLKPWGNETLDMAKIARAHGLNARVFQRFIDNQEGIKEVAPPGMEPWIKSKKKDFKKRYGKDWERILYSTAWKHKKEQELSEVMVMEPWTSGMYADSQILTDEAETIFQGLKEKINSKPDAIFNGFAVFSMNLYGYGYHVFVKQADVKEFYKAIRRIDPGDYEQVESTIEKFVDGLLMTDDYSQYADEIRAVYVRSEMRGTSLGTMMYDYLMSTGKMIVSDENMTIGGIKLWTKFIMDEKKYDVVVFDIDSPSDQAPVYLGTDGSIEVDAESEDSIFSDFSSIDKKLFNDYSIRFLMKKR